MGDIVQTRIGMSFRGLTASKSSDISRSGKLSIISKACRLDQPRIKCYLECLNLLTHNFPLNPVPGLERLLQTEFTKSRNVARLHLPIAVVWLGATGQAINKLTPRTELGQRLL